MAWTSPPPGNLYVFHWWNSKKAWGSVRKHDAILWIEESKKDFPITGVPVPQDSPAPHLGYLGHKPHHILFSPGATSLASWRRKNVPRSRLLEQLNLSDLICRKVFPLPHEAACYRVHLYIVLIDLLRQHHQALRPHRFVTNIWDLIYLFAILTY